MGNKLILYFSHKGENYWPGDGRKILEKGNTEIAAEMIQSVVGGDLFEIVPAVPYTDEYLPLVKQAKKELAAQARPAVAAVPQNIRQYSVVYLCYPNWWGTMPMCVFTVLEQLDLNGIKIAPLCTHAGGGLGNSVADLRRVCPGATVMTGLDIPGYKVAESGNTVARWALNSV